MTHSEIIFYSLVFGGLIITLVTSIAFQYVPVNIEGGPTTIGDGALTVYLYKIPTILVPLRNTFDYLHTPITVSVVHNKPGIIVSNVTLLTNESSPLTFTEFDGHLFCAPSNNTSTTCQATRYGYDEFKSTVLARHDLEVGNITNQYALDITYTINKTSLDHASDIFGWSVSKLDFNLLSYFFIVLIGVIVSRLFKNYSESHTGRKTGLQTADYLWIAFSAVIALIIFANFQQQVHLTRHIITNISLAFGFGFGFDKVLEAGQRLGGKT